LQNYRLYGTRRRIDESKVGYARGCRKAMDTPDHRVLLRAGHDPAVIGEPYPQAIAIAAWLVERNKSFVSGELSYLAMSAGIDIVGRSGFSVVASSEMLQIVLTLIHNVS